MYNVYSHPITYANINTVDDLTNSNLRIAVRFEGALNDLIGGGTNRNKTLGNLMQPQRKRSSSLQHTIFMFALRQAYFSEKVTFVAPTTHVYETLTNHDNMADADSQINYRLVLMRYMRQNGISQFHMLNECPK